MRFARSLYRVVPAMIVTRVSTVVPLKRAMPIVRNARNRRGRRRSVDYRNSTTIQEVPKFGLFLIGPPSDRMDSPSLQLSTLD
jgi:hypothetical protein